MERHKLYGNGSASGITAEDQHIVPQPDSESISPPVGVVPTIYLIDDNLSTLAALRHLLSSFDYHVLAYTDPKKFLVEYDAQLPGCIISDLAMPGCDGIALQMEINARGVHQPIIFLTGNGTIPESVRAMKAGAIEFMTKPVDEDALIVAVSTAIALDSRTRNSRIPLDLLSRREMEILRLIMSGCINKQIGDQCGIRERTVKFHRFNIMKKLGVTNTRELIRFVAGEPRLNFGNM